MQVFARKQKVLLSLVNIVHHVRTCKETIFKKNKPFQADVPKQIDFTAFSHQVHLDWPLLPFSISSTLSPHRSQTVERGQ